MSKAWFALLILVLSFSIASPGAAISVLAVPNTSITVSIETDTVDGTDGECSLREAVIAANTNTVSGPADGE